MTTPNHYDARVNVIAREVAKTFGGSTGPVRDGEYHDHAAYVEVPAHGDLPAYVVYLRMLSWGANAGKLRVTIASKERHNDVSDYGLNFQDAAMNSKRDLQSLMADISRRVVNHPETIASLKTYEQRRQKVLTDQEGVEGYLTKIITKYPDIYLSHKPLTSYVGGFYSRSYGENRSYCEGAVYADGRVDFSRIANLSFDQAQRILNILAED